VAKLHSLAATRARQAAQQRLKNAEAQAQLDESCGIGINFAMHSRLRAAERRVEEARTELRRFDPDSTE
jgi:hypothetical protein